jgi:glycosyltransferase involved in cell wall biosynthesis
MLEAMYLNIPVVATRCIPFVEEHIFENINGFCVDVKDYVSMADAMEKAIKLKGKINMSLYSSNDDRLFDIFN